MPEDKSKEKPPKPTRAEQLQARSSALIKLPDVTHGKHVIDWLDEIGWYSVGAMGSPMPLTWVDIDCWMRVTNTLIDTDDVLLMRHLSKIYVSSLRKSENQNAPAPYTDMEAIDQNAVQEQLKAWALSFPKN